MAMLKDSLVSGSLRVTDTIYTNIASLSILNAPTTSTGTNIGAGTAGNILFSNGTTASYWGATTGITSLGTITTGTWDATTINPNKGGTGINSYTKGDILYAGADIASTATTALSKLSIGTAGYFLKATADGPTWANTTDITALGIITSGTWNATAVALKYGGTGEDNTIIAINKVFAGPSNNGPGNASFRTLVAADVPVITTALETSNELYMLGVTSSATTAVKYNSGVKATNGAVTATTYNGLTLTAVPTGFTIANGTASKTLTVSGTATINAPT